jgi:hypothetical protein
MVAKRMTDDLDFLVLMGQSTEVVESMTTGYGLHQKKIINLGWTEPQNTYEKILALTKKESTIVAIGNMGGKGSETAN